MASVSSFVFLTITASGRHLLPSGAPPDDRFLLTVPPTAAAAAAAAPLAMQTYAAPPIATITGGGYAVPIASAVALLAEAPALLTRHTPPPGCATDWYWDTTVGGAAPIVPSTTASGAEAEAEAQAQVQSQSSVIFSDRAHNGEGWATCQPYRVAARATYSAGVCPDRSAFMTVSKITKVPGPSDAFYLGACCAT